MTSCVVNYLEKKQSSKTDKYFNKNKASNF